MAILEKKIRWWNETDPKKNIKTGVTVGIIQGGFMLLMAVALSYSAGDNFLNYDSYIVVDLAWIAICVWFLHSSASRAAAILLLVRQALAMLVILSQANFIGLVVGAIIALAYWKAIQGTYDIRK